MENQSIHLYGEGKSYKLYQGNMLDLLDVIEQNSIDAIITDPPYELGFMSKSWDSSGIAFQKETWEKCLKVLKPGGYLLAFGGSRTSHRIACAIEDAGFEIRDTIMWLYGSGFPKSMNIGLAIDKKNGVESLDTGIASPNARPNSTKDNTLMRHGMVGKDFNIKKAQNEWDGWGTALKPAYENITVAMKPLSDELFDNVIAIIKEIIAICQLSSDVQLAEKISQLNLVVLNEVVDTVPKNVNKHNKWVDLLEVMGILQLCIMESMNWNIVSLCLKYLEEICYHQSKFTIEMRTSLIIDLKTLNSLLVPDILQNTTPLSEISQHGIMPNVSTVEKFLLDAIKKLNDILMNFVVESATKRAEESNLLPNYEGITVARKPCEGTCVDNVMKYGVGGINIDECRIPMSQDDINMVNAKSSKNPTDNYNQNESKKYGDYALNIATPANEQGRFPANVILTYDESDYEEVCGGMPYTTSTGGSGDASKKSTLGNFDGGWGHDHNCAHLGGLGDEGSVARYFYCAKASKRDRDDGLPEGKHNIHPTVKNTTLMQYLVRLVTPKGGTILDPFNGSGSTGKAAMFENKDRNANYKYIGIELTPEYLPISKARIEYAINYVDVVEEKPVSAEKKKLLNNQINLFDISN